MTRRATTAGTTLLLLGVLGLVAWWGLASRGGGPPDAGEAGRAAPGGSDPAERTVAAPREDPPTPAGSLAGRAPGERAAGGIPQAHDGPARLVNRHGEPLPFVGLRVIAPDGTQAPDLLWTAADGTLAPPGGWRAGTVLRTAWTPRTSSEGFALRALEDLEAHPASGESLPPFDAILVELDPRDAETGERVPGVRWAYHLRMVDYRTPVVPAEDGPIALPLRVGTRAMLRLAIEPPEGYVVFDEVRPWVARHRGTRRVRLVHPLRREARVSLDVARTTDGSPVSPVVLGWALGSYGSSVSGEQWSEPDVVGRLRVPGVPFFRGMPLAVTVGDLAHAAEYSLSPRAAPPIPGAPAPPCTVVSGRLPDAPAEDLVLRADLPPPASWARWRRSGRSDWETTELQPPGKDWGSDRWGPAAGTAAIDVLVSDAAGRPLAGARVHVATPRGQWGVRATTDAEGRARLRDLPEAAHATVSLQEPGRLPVERSIPLVAGVTQEVELREPQGARLSVRVVDGRGRGVGYAWIDAGGLPRGEVQVWDPWTDAQGRAVREALPAGRRVTVTAQRWNVEASHSHGGRASAEVDLVEGETAELTIALPDPR